MTPTRALLFLVGCIGTRGVIAYAAAHAAGSAWALRAMGVFGLAVAAGFFAIHAMGWRKTGPEVFGEKIWWNALRPVHGCLYLAFALMALSGHGDEAWIPLAVDTALGLTAFVAKHSGVTTGWA